MSFIERNFKLKSNIRICLSKCLNSHKAVREDIKKKTADLVKIALLGGRGVRKIIEFSSFTNDEKHGRGGLRVTFHYFIEPNYD